MPNTLIIQHAYLRRAVPALTQYVDLLETTRDISLGFVKRAYLDLSEIQYRRYRLLLKASRMTEASLKSAIEEMLGFTFNSSELDVFQLAQIFDALFDECGPLDAECAVEVLEQQFAAFLQFLRDQVITQLTTLLAFPTTFMGTGITTPLLYDIRDLVRGCVPEGAEVADLLCLLPLIVVQEGQTEPQITEEEITGRLKAWLIEIIDTEVNDVIFVPFYSNPNDLIVQGLPLLAIIERLVQIETDPNLSTSIELQAERTVLQDILQQQHNSSAFNFQAVFDHYRTMIQTRFEMLILGAAAGDLTWNTQYNQSPSTDFPNGSLNFSDATTGVYGIRNAYSVIHNYRVGAETIGAWLAREFSQLSLLERYTAFNAVLGPVIVQRTTNSFPGIADSFGYTVDHTINDRFGGFTGSSFRSAKSPMSAPLFTHELTHVFVNSAGFGSRLNSPLLETSVNLNRMLEILNASAGLNPYRCVQVACNDAGFEGNGANGNEIVANFIQNVAFGRICLNSSNCTALNTVPVEFDPVFEQGLVRNVLRSSPPATIASELNVAAPIMRDVGIAGRPIYPSSSGNGFVDITLPSGSVQIYGKSPDETRLYIAINRGGIDRGGGRSEWFDHVWVDTVNINIETPALDALAELAVDSTTSFQVGPSGVIIYP